MARQSAISKVIDTAEQEAQYDACVKRLLSQKIILAWILKECVNEFKPFSIPQVMGCIEGDVKVATVAVDADELDYVKEESTDTQIEGLNTEDVSIKEGTVYYDIRFFAIVPDTKEPVQLIINVEAQKSDKTTYPLIKRAIYYVSRMISAEKRPEEKKAILERDFDIPMSIEMEEEANSMCNLGEGIREQAELKTKVDDIIRVSRAMDVSIDRAMELLGVNQSKTNSFREIIDSQMSMVQ